MPHHVVQRGNRQQAVFGGAEDYKQYCHWMNKYSAINGVDITAFCLMTNHVHFIVIPKSEDGIGKTFSIVQMRYAQYMNKKRKTNGHLWQGRYYSCILDDQHLYRAVRYVEMNPVRARMVKKPVDYLWSSARWHSGIDQESNIFLKDIRMVGKNEWLEYLEESDGNFDEMIRRKTQKGLAAGDAEFIEKLETRFKCVLKEKTAGRPRKIGK